jgi:hypothetical protein
MNKNTRMELAWLAPLSLMIFDLCCAGKIAVEEWSHLSRVIIRVQPQQHYRHPVIGLTQAPRRDNNGI